MNAVVEQPMQWRCECGKRMWLHIEHCYECGHPRPAPPPEKKPTDTPLAERAGGLNWDIDVHRRRLKRNS